MPRITAARPICTAPDCIRLVVVKIETSEPGLYGIGCATFTQRPLAVVSAVRDYLEPFLIGRDVQQIEDIYQSAYVSSYWRSGPVLNNALPAWIRPCGTSKASWRACPCTSCSGASVATLYRSTRTRQGVRSRSWRTGRAFMDRGYRYVRCQIAVPRMSTYGSEAWALSASPMPARLRLEQAPWEATPYCRLIPKVFEHLRDKLGEEIELLHDVHERVSPIQAIALAKELEQYHLFFLEDLFAPEDSEYFRIVRQQTTTPLAMGELFVNQAEYVSLIRDRLIDFIRVISQP